MVKGIRSYSNKERRKVRRANHLALDLRTPKYGQRVVEPKVYKKPKYKANYDDTDD